MKPVTFGRADAAVMRVLAPSIRGWCWLTGKTPQALARLLVFVSLVFLVVFVVKSSPGWWVAGVVMIPLLLFGRWREIKEWEYVIGATLPKTGFDVRHRTAWWLGVAVVVIWTIVGGMQVRDDALGGWMIFDTLLDYAITWTGRPPASVLSRLRFSLPRLNPVQL